MIDPNGSTSSDGAGEPGKNGGSVWAGMVGSGTIAQPDKREDDGHRQGLKAARS
jgi:hypothetical protein